MQFVALGNQNTEADAHDFMARHALTFPSFWEDGYASWQAFRIQLQPASVLVAPDGRELGRWPGELNSSNQAEAIALAQKA